MTSLAIRCIAIAAMLLDHIGHMFYDVLPHYLLLRMVGRVAFPLFAFLLAEGMYHTKDVRKYLLRLGMFAVISELPFDGLVSQGRSWFDWGAQNVFFTLFLGLLGILLYDVFAAQNRAWLSLLSILAAAGAAQLIGADYGAVGVYFIFVFYRFRGDRRRLAIFFMVGVLINMSMRLLGGQTTWGLVQLCEIGALPVVLLYNGLPGKRTKLLQYAFYSFYPMHMLILTIIHQM